MKTTAQILTELDLAIGFDRVEEHALIDDINEAGRELVNTHGWKWRNGTQQILHAVAGQNWLALPSDYGDEPAIVAIDGSPVSIVQREDLLRLRYPIGGAVINTYGWMVCPLTYAQDPDTTGLPTPRLELDRAPETSGPLLVMIYKRCWRELSEDDPEARPNVTIEFLKPLLHKARANAMRREGMIQEAEQEEAAADNALKPLLDADARVTINVGRATGGADRFECNRRRGYPPVTSITIVP